MFSKVLVANRGEIAIRAFRAAYEVGAKTVAVFPHEDRWSEHRLKADEAYEIGERGHPVRAYLDPEAIVAVAVKAGADAVYPGYGFLSENPALAEACANAGITFVGPTSEVLTLTGNKARAIAAAKAELLGGLPLDGRAVIPADAEALEPHLNDRLTTITFGAGGDVFALRSARRGPGLEAMIGTPAAVNLSAHALVPAMNTGSALTKATRASIAHWA